MSVLTKYKPRWFPSVFEGPRYIKTIMNEFEGSEEPLLKSGELAKLLRVTRTTMLTWAHRFGCPHVKFPGSIRFRRSEVDRWLRGRENKTEVREAPDAQD